MQQQEVGIKISLNSRKREELEKQYGLVNTVSRRLNNYDDLLAKAEIFAKKMINDTKAGR